MQGTSEITHTLKYKMNLEWFQHKIQGKYL